MLNVILLTDKKAGHESISNGIVDFLSKKYDINIIRITAKRRVKAFIKLGIYLCNILNLNKNNVSFLSKIIYKNIRLEKYDKPDLIISTGGDTSLLNVFFSKYFDIPNFYCSSLRGLNPKFFTRIISIIDNGYENEVLLDISPINVEIEKKELDGKFFSILIGGPTKNYKFTDNEFIKMVEKLIHLAEKSNYKILFTTSRRTPKDVEISLKSIINNRKSLFEKVVFYNEKPEKVMKYFLKNSDAIFCTEDSGSMITEAILSHKKVYTISSKNKKLDKIFKTFISNLTEKRFIKSIDIDSIEKVTLNEEFKKIDYLPAQKVYEEIKKVVKL